jgi:heat shock protein HtpX
MLTLPKRILFFVLTNMLVIFLMGMVCWIFGVESYMTGTGLNLKALLIFSALFGFLGSGVSLLLSKWMAKRGTGTVIIKAPSNPTEQWLMDSVRHLSSKAGIGMPEVGIFPSPAPNAFATGWNRNNALVAVSAGLLESMGQDEVEAVLAHEVAHVANGDMITMALMQGVMNTFVIFLSRVIGYAVDKLVLKNERGYGLGYYATVIIAQIALGMLAGIVVSWFSRLREYRADAGAARLHSPEAMISALEALRDPNPSQMPKSLAAFGIRSGRASGFRALLSTHPDINDRIAALQRFKTHAA